MAENHMDSEMVIVEEIEKECSRADLQKNSVEYCTLLDKMETLRNQQKEILKFKEYEQAKDKHADDSNEELIKKLDDILQKCKDNETLSEITIPSLQVADTLYRATLGQLESGSEFDETQTEAIENLLKEIAETSSLISKESEEVDALQSDILKLQLDIASISTKRCNLMKKLQQKENEENEAMENAQEENQVKKLQEKIDNGVKALRVTNNILQLLITQTGLNWAEDEKLLQIVLDCGKPLDEQLLNCESTNSS